MRASTLIASTVAMAATATVGDLATRTAKESVWYRQLRKPAYQPPRAGFPIVRSALYADSAVVSAATVDRLRDAWNRPVARAYSRALAVNLPLNAGWSWVFFNRRYLAAAVAVNAALTAWLALYPGWSAVALVPSVHIRLLNRRGGIDVP